MLNKPSFCVRLARLRCGLARTLACTTGVVLTLGTALWAQADPARSSADSNVERYWIEAPVVDSQRVIEERTVERTERICEPVRNGYIKRYHSDNRDRHYTRYRHEERVQRRHGGTGASILGGLIGGAIGNQFGGGNGRKALTIAGALVGSNIARNRTQQRYRHRDYDAGYSSEYEPEYECRTRTRPRTTQDVVGYDVTYRYNNQLYTRRQEHAPGDTIKLRVRAVPDVAI